MKTKWPLFLGITLLSTGIVLKSMAIQSAMPLILILSGPAFKLHYIINKIVIGAYRPGFEVLLLFVGLAAFLTGIYLKNRNATFNYLY